MLGINRARYYRHWQASAPREMDTILRDRIQQIALKNRHYGYRRVTAQLRIEGWKVNPKHVLRLMKRDNLLCLRRRAFIPMTTDARHEWTLWPNLTRRIQTSTINQLWVSDITYIRLREEFVFLAVVLDAHSRRVVGWSLGTQLHARLAIDALKMALQLRNPPPGLIHHSDRGVQYACPDYTRILQNRNIQISMSRPGNPYDNAKAESFMKTLKCEQIHGVSFRNFDELHRSIQRFIDEIYNSQRLHSALAYRSPVMFEQQFVQTGGGVSYPLLLGNGGTAPFPRPQPPSPPPGNGGGRH